MEATLHGRLRLREDMWMRQVWSRGIQTIVEHPCIEQIEDAILHADRI